MSFSIPLHNISLRQGLPLSQSYWFQLGWLAVHWSPRLCLSLPLSASITGKSCHAQLFSWCWGLKPSHLHGKCSCPVSHPPDVPLLLTKATRVLTKSLIESSGKLDSEKVTGSRLRKTFLGGSSLSVEPGPGFISPSRCTLTRPILY